MHIYASIYIFIIHRVAWHASFLAETNPFENLHCQVGPLVVAKSLVKIGETVTKEISTAHFLFSHSPLSRTHGYHACMED